MSRYMGLIIKTVLFRIDPCRDIKCEQISRPSAQFRRILSDGNRMKVHHRVKTLILIAERHPVFQSSQIISKRQISRSLHSAKQNLISVYHNAFLSSPYAILKQRIRPIQFFNQYSTDFLSRQEIVARQNERDRIAVPPVCYTGIAKSVSFRFTSAGRTIPIKRSLLEARLKPGILTGTGCRFRSCTGRFRSRTRPYRFVTTAAVSAVIIIAATAVPISAKQTASVLPTEKQ